MTYRTHSTTTPNMTRKTPSRTKRELEKIRRQRRNGDEPGDGLDEIVVELTAVAPRGLDDDPLTEEDVTTIEWLNVDLESGETTRPDRPAPDDLPECSTPDCENPSLPYEFESDCEKCAEMPRRDWRPCVRENEEDA